jgi:predicted nucleic acid-binding protein
VFSLKNGFKRKEFFDIDPRKKIEQQEFSLRDAFHVLLMKKNLVLVFITVIRDVISNTFLVLIIMI